MPNFCWDCLCLYFCSVSIVFHFVLLGERRPSVDQLRQLNLQHSLIHNYYHGGKNKLCIIYSWMHLCIIYSECIYSYLHDYYNIRHRLGFSGKESYRNAPFRTLSISWFKILLYTVDTSFHFIIINYYMGFLKNLILCYILILLPKKVSFEWW